jgi:adenylate cyclase
MSSCAGAIAGLAAAEEGLHAAATTTDRSYWPELWRLKGELLLAQAATARSRRRGRGAAPSDHDWSAAEYCFVQAIERARGCEARSLELRAATSLARLWLARGRGAEARGLLEPLYRWFGDTRGADLDEARALMTELGRVRRGRASGRARQRT